MSLGGCEKTRAENLIFTKKLSGRRGSLYEARPGTFTAKVSSGYRRLCIEYEFTGNVIATIEPDKIPTGDQAGCSKGERAR